MFYILFDNPVDKQNMFFFWNSYETASIQQVYASKNAIQ